MFIFVGEYLIVIFVVFDCVEEEVYVGFDLVVEGIFIFIKFFGVWVGNYVFVRELCLLDSIVVVFGFVYVFKNKFFCF